MRFLCIFRFFPNFMRRIEMSEFYKYNLGAHTSGAMFEFRVFWSSHFSSQYSQVISAVKPCLCIIIPSVHHFVMGFMCIWWKRGHSPWSMFCAKGCSRIYSKQLTVNQVKVTAFFLQEVLTSSLCSLLSISSSSSSECFLSFFTSLQTEEAVESCKSTAPPRQPEQRGYCEVRKGAAGV